MPDTPAKHTEAINMNDSEKLRKLAQWFDSTPPGNGDEVQMDLRRIGSILANLPYTADGVAVTPGMRVFRPIGGGVISMDVQTINRSTLFSGDDYWFAPYSYSKASLAMAVIESRAAIASAEACLTK